MTFYPNEQQYWGNPLSNCEDKEANSGKFGSILLKCTIKSGSRCEWGGGGGKPAPGFVASPAEAGRGGEGRKTLRPPNPCRPESVCTPGESVTATSALSMLSFLLQPQDKARLSPRSPVRFQRISLLSLQNVGTVTLRRVVFSQPADPPKDSLDRDKGHLSCAALM